MVHDCTAIAAGFGEPEMNRAILENLRFFLQFSFLMRKEISVNFFNLTFRAKGITKDLIIFVNCISF